MILIIGCSKEPCDDLESGIYVYPDATGKSFEETIEIYKIPDQVLQCISTDGLVQTCISYPEMRMVWTRNSLQQGIDYIENICNGFEELWRREDKFYAIIDLYKLLDFERDWTKYSDLENGSYVSNIIYHEIIIAQNEILQDLTDSQKIELFELVLEKLKLKMVKYEDFGGLGMAGSVAILSRIMLSDQYPPFLEKYEENWVLMNAVELIAGLDENGSEEIINFSEDYLEHLKTNN
jgi:hypothetical protein